MASGPRYGAFAIASSARSRGAARLAWVVVLGMDCAVAAVLSGCDQVHLTIGAETRPMDGVVIDAAAPDSLDDVDARTAPIPPAADARRPVVDSTADADIPYVGEPMITFHVLGREPVSSLWPACSDDCIEVSARVYGVEPPYEVHWQDGTIGMTRQVCAAELLQPSGAPWQVVQVESDAGVSAAAMLQLMPGVCPESPSQQGWQVCYMGRLVSLDRTGCAGVQTSARGTFELAEALPAGADLSVTAYYEGTPFSYAELSLASAAEVCSPPQVFATGQGQPLTVAALSWAGRTETAIRYLHVDSSDGRLLPYQVTVCEYR